MGGSTFTYPATSHVFQQPTQACCVRANIAATTRQLDTLRNIFYSTINYDSYENILATKSGTFV